jgi:peptide/nickel transport system substrate-binding protein
MKRISHVSGKGKMEKIKVKSFISVIALFLTVLLLLAEVHSLWAAEAKPRYGGTLRLSENFDGVNIGYPPTTVKTNYAFRQMQSAIETLLRFDKAGQLVPWLATAFKGDAKTKTITFTIRKGVKFHDGTDLDAEAVKWNLEQHRVTKTPGTEKMTSITVLNPGSIRIDLSQLDSTVTANMAQFLGMVVSPTAYKKNGQAWSEKNPVGTGPFKFVSQEKEVRTIYTKFDDYWQKGKPYLDRVEFMSIVDIQTRELALRRGEIDVALRIATKSVTQLEKEGYIVVRATGGSCTICLVPSSANSNSPFA